MKRIAGPALFFLCFAWASAHSSPPTDIKEIRTQSMAREFVEANLKDPESAKYRNQKGLCGEVNSKNSYGGYGGFQKFMAANKSMVAFERGDQMSASEFRKAWNQLCR